MFIKKNNRSKVKRSKLKRVKRIVKRSLKRRSFKKNKKIKKKVHTKRIKRMRGGSWRDAAEAEAAAVSAARRRRIASSHHPSHKFELVRDHSAGSHNANFKCINPSCDAHYGSGGSEGTDQPCPWKKPVQVAPKVNSIQMIHATLDDSNFVKDFTGDGAGTTYAIANGIDIGAQFIFPQNIICKRCKKIAWDRDVMNRLPCLP